MHRKQFLYPRHVIVNLHKASGAFLAITDKIVNNPLSNSIL